MELEMMVDFEYILNAFLNLIYTDPAIPTIDWTALPPEELFCFLEMSTGSVELSAGVETANIICPEIVFIPLT